MIDSSNLRLECLKLAHRPDQTSDEVIARAKAYEKYVEGAGKAAKAAEPGTPDNRPRRPGRPPGKSGKR